MKRKIGVIALSFFVSILVGTAFATQWSVPRDVDVTFQVINANTFAEVTRGTLIFTVTNQDVLNARLVPSHGLTQIQLRDIVRNEFGRAFSPRFEALDGTLIRTADGVTQQLLVLEVVPRRAVVPR